VCVCVCVITVALIYFLEVPSLHVGCVSNARICIHCAMLFVLNKSLLLLSQAHVAYHEMMAESGASGATWSDFPGPADEWDDIALNYTSGTWSSLYNRPCGMLSAWIATCISAYACVRACIHADMSVG
jgi:hypothetical protein